MTTNHTNIASTEDRPLLLENRVMKGQAVAWTGEIPFKGAIFDLDGTLLDSLDVWRRVDARFFAARGLAIPEDYTRAIAGMSFRQCAEYTVARFHLPQTPEAVMDEWMAETAREYARSVTLAKGAREYLRMLKRSGVRLAVATANRPALFEPTLERCGVLELFDALCTTDEVGDRSKAGGEVFLLAAKRLKLDPADCAVFEDVPDGLAGARRAGMRAYALRGPAAAYDEGTLAALADGVAADFDAMRAFHPFPDNARRCVIFTARCEGDVARAYAPKAKDYVLCADGGWELARRAGVTPDCVLGDFDSSDAPAGVTVRRFPREKDDTDTMLCLKQGLAMGFDDFWIVGGFGGRLDHTLANLQTLHYAALRGARAQMRDGGAWASAVCRGQVRVPNLGGGFSVFALDERCAGVSIRGAKYQVEDAVLSNAFPLGVSNAFAGDEALVSVKEGTLLAVATAQA